MTCSTGILDPHSFYRPSTTLFVKGAGTSSMLSAARTPELGVDHRSQPRFVRIFEVGSM
jgi:hypothetical protein